MIFKILNDSIQDVATLSDYESRGKIRTVWAIARRIRLFAGRTDVSMVGYDVFFTTITNWSSQSFATSTGVGGD